MFAVQLRLCLLFSLLLPGTSLAATTVVDSDKELAWLERQKKIEGSVVIRIPGLTALSLPRLQEVTERLEIAIPDLVSLSLPALKSVGTDLNVGCTLHPREEWETKGPLSPVPPLEVGQPSFSDGPPSTRHSKDRAPVASGPTRLGFPQLRTVGGGMSVCSPGILGVDAPKLTRVGTDLQFLAARSWTSIELASLSQVRTTFFAWIDDTTLTISAPKLTKVGAAVQVGGAGVLSLSLPALEMTAGLALTGFRRSSSGKDAETPSLTVSALDLPRLARSSRMVELRAVGGLSTLALPSLSQTASIRIEDLPDLVALEMPALTQVEGSVVLSRLPALESLGLDALVSVGERYQLGGLGLETLALGIEQVGSLVLSGQPSKVVRADKLRNAGAMLLEGLGLIELVSFEVLETVTSQLQVRDNVALGPGTDLPEIADDDLTQRIFDAPKLRQVGESRQHGFVIRRGAFTAVRLPALRKVHGDLSFIEMPALTQLQLPRLERVEGKLRVGGSRRLEVLEFPVLSKTEVLELISLTELKRVVARALDSTVRQSSGTKVGVLDVGGSE